MLRPPTVVLAKIVVVEVLSYVRVPLQINGNPVLFPRSMTQTEGKKGRKTFFAAYGHDAKSNQVAAGESGEPLKRLRQIFGPAASSITLPVAASPTAVRVTRRSWKTSRSA